MATDQELLDTLFKLPEAKENKAIVIDIAQGAGLPAGDFIEGDPSERWIEISARAMDVFSTIGEAAVRGNFVTFATDPGDPGDTSIDQTPRPGFLSVRGLANGVERAGQLYAVGFVTITNGGSTTTHPFKAGQLTFEASGATRADGGTPTYTNTADPSIYVGIGGTLTLAAGASVVIPILAEQIGDYGSVGPGEIDLAVVQSFQTSGVLTCTNASSVLGREREEADAYRARVKLAPNKLSPGGPQKAYLYAMNTAKDGTPLQRFDGSGTVAITMAYVSPRSPTADVTIYFGGPSGAVSAVDVSTANANITGIPLGIITDPIGVLPDAVLLLPTPADPNTLGPGGASCTNTTTALVYTAKMKASDVPGGASAGVYTSGGSPPAPVAAVFTEIATAYGAYLLSTGIGGLDQVAGAGVVYTSDIAVAIRDAVAGLYAVAVTTPGTPTIAVTLGHIRTAGSISGTLTLV